MLASDYESTHTMIGWRWPSRPYHALQAFQSIIVLQPVGNLRLNVFEYGGELDIRVGVTRLMRICWIVAFSNTIVREMEGAVVQYLRVLLLVVVDQIDRIDS